MRRNSQVNSKAKGLNPLLLAQIVFRRLHKINSLLKQTLAMRLRLKSQAGFLNIWDGLQE
ncbi:hypothetical protein AMR41_02885 [Hapalosiphon sp. MRB220]|nr:hypothetical protein AMR41_02885 [Hapalosiphon sp. MRB220]